MLEYLGGLNGLFAFGGGGGVAAAAAGGSDSLSFAQPGSATGPGAESPLPDIDYFNFDQDLDPSDASMATDLLASGDKTATAGKLKEPLSLIFPAKQYNRRWILNTVAKIILRMCH